VVGDVGVGRGGREGQEWRVSGWWPMDWRRAEMMEIECKRLVEEAQKRMKMKIKIKIETNQ